MAADKKDAVKELSMEHERFCWLYVRKGNATRCYMMVYPEASEESARRAASRLMTNVDIQARIGMLCAERNAELETSEEDIRRDLSRLKRFNAQDAYTPDGSIIPVHEMDPDLTYCIKSIEYESINTKDGGTIGMTTKITFVDKVKPIELLGKNNGMWKEVGSKDNPLQQVTKVELVAL